VKHGGCVAQDTGGVVDSPKGWAKQGNSPLRSNEWTLKADTGLSLLNPPRQAEAKKGGEPERSEGRRGEFLP